MAQKHKPERANVVVIGAGASGATAAKVLTELEQPVREQEEELAEDEVRAAWAPPPEPALQQSMTETGLEFVPLLALHTRQGFYADPIYGGNKNRVGWKLIRFEGPESLAETHAGRFTTLPYFAEQQIDWEEQKHYGAKA